MFNKNKEGYLYKKQELKYDKPEIKKDCISYRDKECDCLNELFCKTELCSFYKSKKEN